MIINFGIYARYLIYRTFFISSFVFLAFLILDSIFLVIAELEDISESYSVNDLIMYILGIMPHRSLTYLEGSCLLGILISMSISHQEGNLNVLRSAGFSPFKISFIASLGSLLMIFILLISDEFYFKDIGMNSEIEKRLLIDESKDLNKLSSNWVEDRGTFLQYYIKDKDSLYDISIVKVEDNKVVFVANANNAKILEKSILLNEPYSYKDFTQDVNQDPEIPFIFPAVLQLSSPNVRNIRLLDQLDYLQDIKATDSEIDNSFKSELEKNIYRTLFLPISALSIMLLAGSLMFGSLRNSAMGTKIIFGVVCGFIYSVLQDLSVSIFISYSLNILVSIILPILFVLGLCIFFYRKI